MSVVWCYFHCVIFSAKWKTRFFHHNHNLGFVMKYLRKWLRKVSLVNIVLLKFIFWLIHFRLSQRNNLTLEDQRCLQHKCCFSSCLVTLKIFFYIRSVLYIIQNQRQMIMPTNDVIKWNYATIFKYHKNLTGIRRNSLC